MTDWQLQSFLQVFFKVIKLMLLKTFTLAFYIIFRILIITYSCFSLFSFPANTSSGRNSIAFEEKFLTSIKNKANDTMLRFLELHFCHLVLPLISYKKQHYLSSSVWEAAAWSSVTFRAPDLKPAVPSSSTYSSALTTKTRLLSKLQDAMVFFPAKCRYRFGKI